MIEDIFAFDPSKGKKIKAGTKIGKTFYKEVKKSLHFMKYNTSYAIQEDLILSLRAKGIDKIVIEEIDTGKKWVSYLISWINDGRVEEYGHGNQRFLSLMYMKPYKREDNQEGLF